MRSRGSVLDRGGGRQRIQQALRRQEVIQRAGTGRGYTRLRVRHDSSSAEGKTDTGAEQGLGFHIPVAAGQPGEAVVVRVLGNGLEDINIVLAQADARDHIDRVHHDGAHTRRRDLRRNGSGWHKHVVDLLGDRHESQVASDENRHASRRVPFIIREFLVGGGGGGPHTLPPKISGLRGPLVDEVLGTTVLLGKDDVRLRGLEAHEQGSPTGGIGRLRVQVLNLPLLLASLIAAPHSGGQGSGGHSGRGSSGGGQLLRSRSRRCQHRRHEGGTGASVAVLRRRRGDNRRLNPFVVQRLILTKGVGIGIRVVEAEAVPQADRGANRDR